ncbi:MAG: 50S ribosomal protein L6 [Planctomycetota bacterium]
MSRLGKKPVDITSGVEVKISGQHVMTKGPKGTLEFDVHPRISVAQEENQVVVTRDNDQGPAKALHGTTRAIIANMIEGVSKGYEKKLEVHGVGYKAELRGKKLALTVGYANTISVDIPDGVEVKSEAGTPGIVTVSGPEKQKVGQFAAKVRDVRKPEPYKGKGIRYADEQVTIKQGKGFGAK